MSFPRWAIAAAAAFIVSTVLAVALIGCADAARDEAKFVGAWDIVSLKANDGRTSYDDLVGDLRSSGSDMSIILGDDGTATMKLSFSTTDDSSSGIWKLKDANSVTLTIDGVDSDAVLDDQGRLVFSQDGMEMVCEKRGGKS